MFVHTLGFEKQGCIGIIEDCFVNQQHLMEEEPEIVTKTPKCEKGV